MYAALFSLLFLVVGVLAGWFFAEKYIAFVHLQMEEPHEFQELFEENPHPELFDTEGNLYKGEYWTINIPHDFDPEKDSFYIEDPEADEEW